MTATPIRSDDPNALALLREKLDSMEAERARVAAYNKTCRQGQPDVSLLDAKQRADLVSCLRLTAYNCPGGRVPAYVSSNLSGNIKRVKERIAALSR